MPIVPIGSAMCEIAPQKKTTIPATIAPTRTSYHGLHSEIGDDNELDTPETTSSSYSSRGSGAITMSEFDEIVGRPGDYRRQRAQTIKPPIMTNTTGRNHLSRNRCMGGPTPSAALPLEMSGEHSKRDLAITSVP